MLSYRHSYHAGNYADVLKHTVLIHVLDYFKRKAKPFCYVDTHAGAGAYSLKSEQAEKNQEYLQGVAKIWQQANLPPVLSRYVEVITAAGFDTSFTQYAGSPLIAKQLLRHQDYAFLYELHGADFQHLQALFAQQSQVQTHQQDGFKHCLGLMPPTQKRGLSLIDPSYEMKSDYDQVVDSLESMYQRFSSGTFMLWYPVVERHRINELERKLKASSLKNVQLFELGQSEDTLEHGMTANGMIVVNPPWTLKDDMQPALVYLAEQLGLNGQGYYRFKQLIEE